MLVSIDFSVLEEHGGSYFYDGGLFFCCDYWLRESNSFKVAELDSG